jgi:hypothetical protein
MHGIQVGGDITLLLCTLATERPVHLETRDQQAFLWNIPLHRPHVTHRFINTGQQKAANSRNRLIRPAM